MEAQANDVTMLNGNIATFSIPLTHNLSAGLVQVTGLITGRARTPGVEGNDYIVVSLNLQFCKIIPYTGITMTLTWTRPHFLVRVDSSF
jgi:hypothetical protein